MPASNCPFWSGALLQSSSRSQEPQGKTLPVVIFRSAAQRVAVHVDEVLGNQEVVVKNLGPQMARLPGLAGMTVLASGAVVLIYNPVALAQVYGEQARLMSADHAQPEMLEQAGQPAMPAAPAVPAVPLVLVVDDSITVRRVTQRLLTREGYRVALAADGLQALERLAEAADGGAFGHRDAAHGRLRPGPQHPRRRAPGAPADRDDHLAHRLPASTPRNWA